MNVTLSFGEFIVAVLSPTAVTGFLIWLLQRRLDKSEKNSQARDEARRKNELLIARMVMASVALGEATATAIKNGKSNGETEKALAYAQEVKHEYRDFQTEQSVKNIY